MLEILTLEFVNSIWSFQLFVIPLYPTTRHETGGGSESGPANPSKAKEITPIIILHSDLNVFVI